MTHEETVEQRAQEIFARFEAAARSHAEGDELANRRITQMTAEMANEPPGVISRVKAMLSEHRQHLDAQAAWLNESQAADEQLAKIWQERYPNAQTVGEVIELAAADGLDLMPLADKAFPAELLESVMGDPLAPLDALADDTPIISMTVQCNTEGLNHCVEVHAMNRDGKRVYSWTVNRIEGDEYGMAEMYGALGPTGAPNGPLSTPREAFEAAMQALHNYGGPANLLKEAQEPLDLDALLVGSSARRRRSAPRLLRRLA